MQPGRAPLLIVDDDAAIRDAIHILLEEDGYTIIEACNGNDALAMLREHEESLVVLLDDLMPELGGEELLRVILRDRALRRRHTFIFLSGYPHLSRRLRLQRMVRALAIEVVPKPFDIADLEQAVVRAQTRQHRQRSFRLPVPRWSRSTAGER